MTDFNALPLAEKIKQAQAGDIVVTDSGARLPLDDCYLGHPDPFTVGVTLLKSQWIAETEIADIIRPTARKVPEVVYMIDREVKSALAADTQEKAISALIRAVSAVADHFEKETP